MLFIYPCDFAGANDYVSEMSQALLMLGAGDGQWRKIAKGDVSSIN